MSYKQIQSIYKYKIFLYHEKTSESPLMTNKTL